MAPTASNDRGVEVVPTDVTIRPFRADDQDAVRRLVLDGLRDHWGEIDPGLNRDLDDIAASFAHGRTLVAVLDDEVVGTATAVPFDERSLDVVRMSVASACRGRGIGRRLVAALDAHAVALGVDRLVLETTATWHDTVAFYVGCGFRVTHHVDGPFGRDLWFERPVGRTSA